MNAGPTAATEEAGSEIRATLSGLWTAPYAAAVEKEAQTLLDASQGAGRVILDISGIQRLDTLGAWVLDRTRHELGDRGLHADFVGARPEQSILLNEIAYRSGNELTKRRKSRLVDFLAEVGEAVVNAGRDMARGISFLGETTAGLARVFANPKRFRFTSLVNQLEQVAFRGVPIIALISFLVGCIIAQQGIFQLQRFGAVTFVVDLVGILVLRELGVLLTSIMVAGRSGSAFTAEIGSMKMREEVDALRVMGLDPIEVLIIPRVLALIIGLPLLTFISEMAALFGGGLVAWIYGGISPEIYLARLQSAIDFNTFLVGMIKAPFMALVIGLIASLEGLAVAGSAESLGRQVTAAVVKSIFMVIVVDGLFAMFFAAIRF
ncbi:MAG: MlaE family lipid ABC transporter permease subunit [Chelatococcus sp.]|uniref:ABC transporter permease n=1 Tax=Chelatococcus sp. TaxID=1953771 RepID=UPI0025BDA485|nr:MlaE family lipid ABC transporter permease subunit [Chelatococcus sp.]MBX3536111.1 MlaE family lipid ABC transporter permease subunit [Chelatococcus sp.]